MTDPTSILESCASTYEDKNDDYGDSWRLVGEFLWLLANNGITLETKEDFISFGLYTRRLDKIARAFNGEFNDDDLNFESVMDSHEDEATYAAMHATNQSDRESEFHHPHPDELEVAPEDTEQEEFDPEKMLEPEDGEQVTVLSEESDNYAELIRRIQQSGD